MIVSLWSVHVYVLLSLFHGLDRVGLGWTGLDGFCFCLFRDYYSVT